MKLQFTMIGVALLLFVYLAALLFGSGHGASAWVCVAGSVVMVVEGVHLEMTRRRRR